MKQLSIVLTLTALLGLMIEIPVSSLAAPRQQGVGIKDGECEVVSVGNYFCKVDGKCYYCTKKDNPDPKTDCYKETTCLAATTRPGIKGSARPPLSTSPPVTRRGVEGEQPTSPPTGQEHKAPEPK